MSAHSMIRFAALFALRITPLIWGYRASPGCGRTPMVELGQASLHTLPQSGRRFYLFLPLSYRVEVPSPMILSFHSWLGEPEHMIQDTKFNQHLDSNVVNVFPVGSADIKPHNGSKKSWNGSGSVGSPGPAGPTCRYDIVSASKPCYDSCEAQGGCHDRCWLTTCVDDVGFVEALLNYLELNLCIDTDLIAAVGFSGGGSLTLKLGTDSRVSFRFFVFVVVAAVPMRGFNIPPQLRSGARFLGIWGTRDQTFTAFPNVAGKPDEALAATGWIMSTWQNTTELWAKALDCEAQRHMVAPEHNSSWSWFFEQSASNAEVCSAYMRCSTGSVVAVCIWDGPHAWPEFASEKAWRFISFKAPSTELPGSHVVELGREFVLKTLTLIILGTGCFGLSLRFFRQLMSVGRAHTCMGDLTSKFIF